MRDLQIFILDLQGNQLGELDLTDVDDFALKLTKSIASINDLGRRNTSFSLDFEAPQTKNNNKLLSGLRFATASKEILGKKPCAIMVDGNQIDRGFLYPFASDYDGQYRLVFKGLNNDWVEQLRDVELNELNWRDYLTQNRSEDATELFTSARIDLLNAQNSETTDLIYPYINRNNGSEASSFRPQLHLRSIILSMFEKIGYTVSSSFLESEWIKGDEAYTDANGRPYTHLGIGVDPTFQMTREEADLKGLKIEYKSGSISAPETDPDLWDLAKSMGNLGTPSVPNQRNLYRFPNAIDTLVVDDNTRFDPVTSEYTVPIGGVYRLTFDFAYEWARWNDVTLDWLFWDKDLASPFDVNPPSFKWYVVKNNTSDTIIDGTIIHSTNAFNDGVNTGTPNTNIQFSPPPTTEYSFSAGDKISVFLGLEDLSSGFTPIEYDYLNSPDALQYWRMRILNDSVLKIEAKPTLEEGDTFRINSHIPDGIKCLSLLQDFKTLFNLYFDVDVNRKIVFIETRDDFYNTGAVDITDKVDFTKSPKLNYLTDYKNEFVFKYAKDSKDKYLEQWNKTFDREYAEHTYVMGNNARFEKGQSTLSTSLISATIQGELENGNIMTSIIKEEAKAIDNEGKGVNNNYGARIFQLVRGKQYTPADVERRTLSPEIVTVGIMENYSNTPTFEDKRLTFTGTNGLVQQFYAKTLANIEDTAVIEVMLDLSLYDYKKWNLRDVFHITEPAELSGYYITDSIKNFNVTKEALTPVTLVKFKDYTPVVIPPGTGNVEEGTDDIPEPQAILCTVNGAIVFCLDNDLEKMYKI